MNNISDIKNCYGCGVCAAACPRNIIQIRLNKKGFYEPYIKDSNKCTQCGLCRDVCAYSHKELALESTSIHAWASWSDDEEVRKNVQAAALVLKSVGSSFVNVIKL